MLLRRHLLEGKNVLSIELMRDGLPGLIVAALRQATADHDAESACMLAEMQLAVVALASAMKKDPSPPLAANMPISELLELCASFIEAIPFLLAGTGGLKAWQQSNHLMEDFGAIEDVASKCLIYLTELYPFTTIRQVYLLRRDCLASLFSLALSGGLRVCRF